MLAFMHPSRFYILLWSVDAVSASLKPQDEKLSLFKGVSEHIMC